MLKIFDSNGSYPSLEVVFYYPNDDEDWAAAVNRYKQLWPHCTVIRISGVN